MDLLEKSKQSEICRMSDVSLVSKSTQAGYSLEVIEAMDRLTMFYQWAEIIIAGKKKEVVAKSSVAVVAGGYDAEVERQKLMFQMKQWEDEIAKRKAQREAELKISRRTA